MMTAPAVRERDLLVVRVVPSGASKSDGTPSATTARVSIEAFDADAAPVERHAARCAVRRAGWTRRARAGCCRRTEPMIEARATSIRPSRIVRTTMISSGRLPKVALSSAASARARGRSRLLGGLAEHVGRAPSRSRRRPRRRPRPDAPAWREASANDQAARGDDERDQVGSGENRGASLALADTARTLSCPRHAHPASPTTTAWSRRCLAGSGGRARRASAT